MIMKGQIILNIEPRMDEGELHFFVPVVLFLNKEQLGELLYNLTADQITLEVVTSGKKPNT